MQVVNWLLANKIKDHYSYDKNIIANTSNRFNINNMQ